MGALPASVCMYTDMGSNSAVGKTVGGVGAGRTECKAAGNPYSK